MQSPILANLDELTGFVDKRYADLLSNEEHDWLRRFREAPPPARLLYARLLLRRPVLFRVSRLTYAEIPDIRDALQVLAKLSLVSTEPPADIRLLFSCFMRAEIDALLEHEHPRRLNRAELLDALAGEGVARVQAYRRRLVAADDWVTVQGHGAFAVFRLCFFGNLHQDISEFARQAIGQFRHEVVPLDDGNRAFASREAIEAHLRWYECELCRGNLSVNDVGAMMAFADSLPLPLDASLQRRTDRTRLALARRLAQLGETDKAFRLCRACSSFAAREQEIRLLARCGRPRAAMLLAESLALATLRPREQRLAQTQFTRLARQSGRQLPPVRPYKPETATLVLTQDGRRVEESAADFFARSGTALHVENALFSSMLGLFIWDIVFAPLPGAFHNPFQSAPSDFHDDEFTERRRELLAARLTECDNPEGFAARVRATHEEKQGIRNPLVRWQRIDRDLIELALERIPTRHWKALFEHMLEDLRQYRRGLPDLVHFPDRGGYELLEIKGPGDALQTHQRQWLAWMRDAGIPCRVIKVRWRSSNTVRPA
ncbi:MAG: hypothetical protein CSB44_06310 [Gammaproteobacteria bacterium]|nr:MAG: hypothetical protein CSB44_06310 [Gammaproteobacteria bacterium]